MKYKLDYSVRTTRAPGEETDSWVPFIVERSQPTDLENIVENCIDRGLIAGLKTTAAHGIAEGIAEQLAREFSLGRSIAFGQYFYGRPYLNGTVDMNGRLNGDNTIAVRLYKGNAFKLSLGDFSLSFTEGGDNPKIDFALDGGSCTRGELTSGAAGEIHGSMLYAAGDTNKVIFTPADGTGAPTAVTSFSKQGPRLLAFTTPNLGAGAYSVKVERIDENGVTRTTAAKTVTVNAAPAPAPLLLTSIQTTGEQEGQVNETNTTSIRGQDNLYPWDSERDSVVVHFDGQELTVPDVEFSAGNETLQFQIPQRVGEVLNDDDTLSFTVTINGAVGTIDAVWKH